MKPKMIIILAIYMILVYSCVHTFTNASFEFQDAGVESPGVPVAPPVAGGGWWEQLVNFFSIFVSMLGTVINVIVYTIGFMTFNVFGGQVLSDGSSLPIWLTWIPFMMVLPVHIAIVYWLAPYVIKLIKAVGAWFKVPFAG